MIFCIGREEYERYFQEQKRPHKSGRSLQEGYPGGSVWETEEDARRHCPVGYQVYGVLARWRIDTEPSRDGDWDDLLIDAELVKLEAPFIANLIGLFKASDVGVTTDGSEITEWKDLSGDNNPLMTHPNAECKPTLRLWQ